LGNEALRTVKTFQMTKDNYKFAFWRLVDHYDNNELIFQNVINSLYEIPEIMKPNAMLLRLTNDTVCAVVGQLSNLENDKSIRDTLIILLEISKGNRTSKEKWDESLDHSFRLELMVYFFFKKKVSILNSIRINQTMHLL